MTLGGYARTGFITAAKHREPAESKSRSAIARREEGAYGAYSTNEQRGGTVRIGVRMPRGS